MHFTGSQGTRSNQNAVFSPLSAITPPLFLTTAEQSFRPGKKQEPENKQISSQTKNEIKEGLLNWKPIVFCLFLFQSVSLKSHAVIQEGAVSYAHLCFKPVKPGILPQYNNLRHYKMK